MTLTLISPVQERALEALAVYRFLTPELMRLAGVGRDIKHLREALAVLVRKDMAGKTAEPPFLPGVGRLPNLYWLRPSGADALARMNGMPVPPSFTGDVEAVAELPHRLAIIETHVRLRLWAASADAVVDWFKAEHDPGTRPFAKATATPYDGGTFTPDALAQVTLADGLARPLVIEVYRGGRGGTLDHFRGKLPELRKVCELGAVEAHHAARNAARFLVLFTDDTMRARALQRWPDADAPVWARFFVKSLPEVAADLVGDWWQPGRERRSLF